MRTVSVPSLPNSEDLSECHEDKTSNYESRMISCPGTC